MNIVPFVKDLNVIQMPVPHPGEKKKTFSRNAPLKEKGSTSNKQNNTVVPSEEIQKTERKKV